MVTISKNGYKMKYQTVNFVNIMRLSYIYDQSLGLSRTLEGSGVEFCLILVNGFQPMGLAKRNCILDLAGLPDSPLFNIIVL